MTTKHQNAWYGAGIVSPSPSMENGFTLKYLDSGTAVLNINLLNQETYTSKGEEKTRKTYVPLVAWGAEAEDFASQISKGTEIKVKGSYRNRAYEGRDGKRNYRHDFQIYHLEVTGQVEISAPSTPESTSAPVASAAPAVQQSESAQPAPTFAADGVDEIPF